MLADFTSSPSQRSWRWVLALSNPLDAISLLPFLRTALSESEDRLLILTTPDCKEIFRKAAEVGLKSQSHRLRIVAHSLSWKSLGAWRRLIKQAATEFPPQEVYCADPSFQTAMSAWWSGCQIIYGFSSSVFAFLYTRVLPASLDLGRVQADRMLDFWRSSAKRDLIWKPADWTSLLGVRSAGSSTEVLISLRSRGAAGRWPVDEIAKLLRLSFLDGRSVTLLGDSSDSETAEALQKRMTSPLLKNGLGLPLDQEIDLMTHAGVLLSNDSVDVLLGSEIGIPVIAVFGPTASDHIYGPWRRHSRVVGVENLPCRPCQSVPPERCPKRHHKCLKDIDASRVYSQLDQALATAK